MSVLRKKNVLLLGLMIIFVILPITYFSFGNYNFSSYLTKAEQREFLQVIYSLGASMIILLYYGIKWLLKKNNGIFASLSILNILGIISLYLLFQTMEHNLVMDADFYYLIVYTEIVIVNIMHHIFSKTSVV